MTTILDTLIKELQEEREENANRLATDHMLETADVRGIQGRIWVIDRIFRRIDELRQDPDELREDAEE